jgi:5'-deoxynucleotidase YfbR-like HD superfamily hydrolase
MVSPALTVLPIHRSASGDARTDARSAFVPPIIITKSGKKIDLLQPDPQEFSISDIAHALSHLCRFTGHTRRFYSVAQHSLMVSELVPQALAKEALLHDAAEAYIGDVSTPLKILLPEYRSIEERIELAIHQRFQLDFCDDHRTHIKRADIIMLATERRDLFDLQARQERWRLLDGIEPLHNLIHPLPAEKIMQLFLRRCGELGLG